ncbi:hypothetical protein IPO96_00200 [Candidatus Saccharibacteria bacterium]|nr:MAG: hypothetical protein IPO96_00200 [Candidatus Saccharibacteria bacterium]
MKKIAEMDNVELGIFVAARMACKDAPKGVIAKELESDLTKAERILLAAPYCGICTVRPACLELGNRFPNSQVAGDIYGGVMFGARKTNILRK